MRIGFNDQRSHIDIMNRKTLTARQFTTQHRKHRVNAGASMSSGGPGASMSGGPGAEWRPAAAARPSQAQ